MDTSGAIWGLVSYPRTWGDGDQTTDPYISGLLALTPELQLYRYQAALTSGQLYFDSLFTVDIYILIFCKVNTNTEPFVI